MPLLTCEFLTLIHSHLMPPHTHRQIQTQERIVLRWRGAPLSWGSSTSSCTGLDARKGRDRHSVSALTVATNSVASTVSLNTSAAWQLLRSCMAKSSASGHPSSLMVSGRSIRPHRLRQTGVFFAIRFRTQRRRSCARTWQEPSLEIQRRANANVQRAATCTMRQTKS